MVERGAPRHEGAPEVEAAAEAMYYVDVSTMPNPVNPHWDDQPGGVREDYRMLARAALVAADIEVGNVVYRSVLAAAGYGDRRGSWPSPVVPRAVLDKAIRAGEAARAPVVPLSPGDATP